MKTLITFLFLFFTFYSGFAQQLHPLSEERDSVWVVRVKLLQQFINRFNYTEDFRGNLNNNPFNTPGRQRYLASLFSREFVDNASREELLAFVHQVCDTSNAHYLSLSDDDWYARVLCKATYNGKDNDVVLTFKLQKNEDKSVQWSLVGGNSSLIELKKNEDPLYLAGNAHELNFMRFFVELDTARRAMDYTQANFRPDQLSIILFLLQSGELKLQHAKSITYHFLQVPDWIFSVKEYNRREYNSGWLIYDLQKAKPSHKENFLYQELFLRDIKNREN